MELFGPNSWLTGFYLGALKAAAEMAEHLGETDSAAEYLAIFERGKAWVDEYLFTGEYYTQRIDLGDKQIVAAFEGEDDTLKGGTALMAYWDEEHGEIKYQIGEGSSIDQVLPQWHADLYGLGEISRSGPGAVRPTRPSSSTISFRKWARSTIPAASTVSTMRAAW